MALLELLAGTAPAGVVAADLLVLVEPLGLHVLRDDHLVRRQVGGFRDACRHASGLPGRGRDRFAAGGGVAARVAVRAGVPAADGPGGALLLFLLDLDLD